MVGGYDTSRFAGNLTTFPIGNWTQQPCPLQVTVTQVWYSTPNDTTRNNLFDGNTNSMIACVEPFQQRFTFLPSMVKKFAYWTRYNISNPGLAFPVNLRPNGTLEIRLDNGYRTIIPNDHLFTPKRGSDENGHYVVTNSSIIETGIVYNAEDNDADVRPILGGLFLNFNYLVVDYDNNIFQMAPSIIQGSSANITAVCTPTTTAVGPDAVSSQTNASRANGSSRAAAIGGGTAGAVAGLAIIGILCYFLIRKRRLDRQRPDQKRAEQSFAPMALGPTTFSNAQKPSELALVRQLMSSSR